jgi:hypothetical protein
MARGDHLYVEDRLGGIPFQHHGIDMGDGTVIHLAPTDGPRLTWRDKSEYFSVRRVALEQFSAGRRLRVRTHAQPRQPDEIVAQAESLLGKSGYSLVEDNCEHFATLCATGNSSSHQVEISQATVTSLASAATKFFWSVSSRVGAQTIVKGATRIHPAALLADGVEVIALAVGCSRGLDVKQSKRLARISSNVAAVGIGAVIGGPVGAAVGLAAHQSSRAIAEKVCSVIRQALA